MTISGLQFLVLELCNIDWAQIIVHSRYKIESFADGHVVWLHFKDGELGFENRATQIQWLIIASPKTAIGVYRIPQFDGSTMTAHICCFF
jgi:hypothetical protein